MFVSRKKYNALVTETEKLFTQVEAFKNKHPILIGIERVGRINRFTFVRGDTPYQIDQVGTWSDDIEKWKKELLG